MKYDDLLMSPPPSRADIQKAIKSSSWQSYRVGMKGKSTSDKLSMLRGWLRKRHNSRQSRIQVHNYVNALKRGGQL